MVSCYLSGSFIFILGVMGFAYMYVCVPHSWSAHGGQKRVLDPLKLKEQIIVSRHVGAGELILDPLKGQPVLLTTESALSPVPA